jgi:hypothetical protein
MFHKLGHFNLYMKALHKDVRASLSHIKSASDEIILIVIQSSSILLLGSQATWRNRINFQD